MMVAYLTLTMQLREELENLARVVAAARRSMVGARRHITDSDIYVNSAALNLHSFYTGVERMFLAIAEQVDQRVPTTANWHSDLVNQMTYDLPGIRPPVLANETRQVIHEYRSFRHVVRNVYTCNLDLERVERLVERLPQVLATVQDDVHRFCDFLDAAAQAEIDGEDTG